MRINKIYIIKNNINDKIYIGQTWQDIITRFNNHKRDNRSCPKLVNAFRKYGKNNFSIEEIISTTSQIDADFFEEYFIDYYDSIVSGYNIRNGGSNSILSEEDKKKKSDSAYKRWENVKKESILTGIPHYMAGNNNPMFGNTHSPEAKEKIRISRVNLRKSKENLERDLEILKLSNQGLSSRKIAKILKIGKSTVSVILKIKKEEND